MTGPDHPLVVLLSFATSGHSEYPTPLAYRARPAPCSLSACGPSRDTSRCLPPRVSMGLFLFLQPGAFACSCCLLDLWFTEKVWRLPHAARLRRSLVFTWWAELGLVRVGVTTTGGRQILTGDSHGNNTRMSHAHAPNGRGSSKPSLRRAVCRRSSRRFFSSNNALTSRAIARRSRRFMRHRPGPC